MASRSSFPDGDQPAHDDGAGFAASAESPPFPKQFPLMLGDAPLSEFAYFRLPPVEREMVDRLRKGSLSTRFWENYARLREQGYSSRQSAIGAWHATGRKGRGKYTTAESFANDVMGMTRRGLQKVLAEVRAAADSLRGEWWSDKIADIDAATYEAAILGQSQDRKLAYQRAEVALSERLITPDTSAPAADPWSVLLKAREESGGVKAVNSEEVNEHG